MAESGNTWFAPLHLADANRLQVSGIQMTALPGLTAQRNGIREFLTCCNQMAWVCGQTEQQIQVAFGFQSIDLSSRRAILHLKMDSNHLSQDLLDEILTKAFQTLGFYRLEVTVPAHDTELAGILASSGFHEEGRLRNCFINSVTNRRQDVMLYSMIRPEYKRFGAAFIPFRKGVIVIYGNQKALLLSDFLHYGREIKSDIFQEHAELLDLLDESGRLLSKNAIKEKWPTQRIWVNPTENKLLSSAADQIAAYFTGELSQFDIPLDLHCGSSFQQRVWMLLADIPYGSTWTYEELAYHLTDNNWAAARNLARAVGSACGANPLPLILPCHRVIGKNGRLVGFSGGLDMKEYLLDHEIMGLNE